MAVQYMLFAYLLYVAACVLVLAFGSFLYAMAMTKCIEENLFAIGKSTQAKVKQTEQIELWEQLIEYIEFHSRAKQLSNLTF